MTWKTSVLVVANQTADSDELLRILTERTQRGPTEFTMLIPARRDDDSDRRLEAVLARLREAGLEVRGMVGDVDPVVAVKETWDPGKFDEIVVSTLPTGTSKWLQIDLPHRVERIAGVPVTHVVATARTATA